MPDCIVPGCTGRACRHAVVRVPWCGRAAPPQAEVVSPRTEPKANQEPGITTAPVVVEVRCRCTDPHQVDVHVQFIANAEHVPEQPPVLVDPIRVRFSVEPDECSRRKQPLRDSRGLIAVALG